MAFAVQEFLSEPVSAVLYLAVLSFDMHSLGKNQILRSINTAEEALCKRPSREYEETVGLSGQKTL